MIFLFKPRKIILDCFTKSHILNKLAPIDYAVKFYPKWWKDLPNDYDHNFIKAPTMRKCMGLIDYYKHSICIPMWNEIAVNVDKNRNYNWQFADFNSTATVHDAKQRGSYMPSNNYGHIKLESPWKIKTKEDINWVWSQPTYNFDAPENAVVLPGVINFKHQHASNINFMFDITEPKTFYIETNQPMAFITPMDERKVVLKRHVVDDKEFSKLWDSYGRSSFLNSYTKNKRSNKC